MVSLMGFLDINNEISIYEIIRSTKLESTDNS